MKKLLLGLLSVALLAVGAIIWHGNAYAGSLTNTAVVEMGGAGNKNADTVADPQSLAIEFTESSAVTSPTLKISFSKAWSDNSGSVNSSQTASANSCTSFFRGSPTALPGSLNTSASGLTVSISGISTLTAGTTYCTELTSTTAVTNPTTAGNYDITLSDGTNSEIVAISVSKASSHDIGISYPGGVTKLVAGEQLTISGSNFPDSYLGSVLLCNSAPQSKVIVVKGTPPAPISCTSPVNDNYVNVVNSYGLFTPITFTVPSQGRVGPPNSKPTKAEVAEAASLPCPPTGPQLLKGYYCYITIGVASPSGTQYQAKEPVIFNVHAITAPTGLRATAVSNSSRVELSWGASKWGQGSNTTSPYSGTRYYLVYAGNKEIGRVTPPAGTRVSYETVALTAKKKYNFYIVAQDYLGNLSPKSNIAPATTK